MASGSERERRRSSSRRLFARAAALPYSLYDRDATAEVLFDFRHKQDAVFGRAQHLEDLPFLQLAAGQTVKVNVAVTHHLPRRDLLYGQVLAPEPQERPESKEAAETGCFPRNYVLASAIPRIRPEELQMVTFLGDGGFGRVYSHMYRDRMVAVKETVRRGSRDLLKEVNHEATILAKLSGLGRTNKQDSHVNLCRLVGVMVDIPFLGYSLVLEYCAGGELYDLLHTRKVRLNNYNLVLNYCTQIAEGLEYMHTALDFPIIHRDLKTKNVLLFRDVDPSDPRTLESNTLKLIDFGLSRELAKSHLTTDKGTYTYMAPEAAMQSRHSEQSDIWSLGVVLWEVLVQVVPYTKINEIMVSIAVAKGKVSLPLPDTFPADFRKLLQKCLMLDSERRGDISKLVRELKAMQRHKETLPPEAFLALREEWQLAAENIEVNQTEIWSLVMGGPDPNGCASRDTATVTAQRQPQLLDLNWSLTVGDPDSNIEAEITKTQTEILELRNNFQFSQVAQVALAVTKFKKFAAEIRKDSKSADPPPASPELIPEQTERAHTCTPVESLGSVITRENLNTLELQLKLRQLQLELDRTKREHALEAQRRGDSKRRRRFFSFFSKNTGSLETNSPTDPDMTQTVSTHNQKPRSKTALSKAVAVFKSRFQKSRPPAPPPPEAGLPPCELTLPDILTAELCLPDGPLPAQSAPASPDPASQLELPSLEKQLRLSVSDTDLTS